MYKHYYQIKKITRASGSVEFLVERMHDTGTRINWVGLENGTFNTIEDAREAIQLLKDLEIVKVEIVT